MGFWSYEFQRKVNLFPLYVVIFKVVEIFKAIILPGRILVFERFMNLGIMRMIISGFAYMENYDD